MAPQSPSDLQPKGSIWKKQLQQECQHSLSRWCPGGVQVVSRWCPGGVQVRPGVQVVSSGIKLRPDGLQVGSMCRDQSALLGSVSPLFRALLGQKSSSVVKFCWEVAAGDPLAVGGGVCPELADARLPFLSLVESWGDSAQHWIPMSRTRTIRKAPSSSRWREPLLH